MGLKSSKLKFKKGDRVLCLELDDSWTSGTIVREFVTDIVENTIYSVKMDFPKKTSDGIAHFNIERIKLIDGWFSKKLYKA